MTKDEALKLALEALEPLVRRAAPWGELDWLNGCKAITVIKETLAQPEHGWTPERIAGMARLKEAQDKKLAKPEQDYPENFIHALAFHTAISDLEPEQPKVRTGNCLRVGVCASEGHKIAPQRKPLTNEEIEVLLSEYEQPYAWFQFARAIEAAHGIKG